MKRKAVAMRSKEEEAEPTGSSGAESDSGSQTSSDSGSSGSFPSVSSSEAGSDIEPGDETVSVDFEFFDPKEIDFHGLKALLQTYLDGEAFGCSELVEAIIKQTEVGTVVKTGEGDDPIGVTTVFNLRRNADLAPLTEFKDFLLGRIVRPADQDHLRTAWEAAGTGLLVSERLVNCPPQLAPPLMRALFDEIKDASEEGTSQEEKDAFKFKRYLVVTRAYTDAPPDAEAGAAAGEEDRNASGQTDNKKGKKKKSRVPKTAGDSAIVYVRPEDEYLHKQAAWSCTFAVTNRAIGKDELRPLRLVMLVDASKVAAARRELDQVVGISDSL